MNCCRCGFPVETTRFTLSDEIEGAVCHYNYFDCLKGLKERIEVLEKMYAMFGKLLQ